LTLPFSYATLVRVSKGGQSETLPADQRARLLGSQALPFVRVGGMDAVPCSALDPPEGAARVPVAVVPWRRDGTLRLTVVVKASFSMQGEVMTPAETPEPIRATDAHHRGQPLTHVVAASDRVPWKTRVDVTALGHACAPGGDPVTELSARLCLLQGETAVIDKTVRVVGNREGPDGEPEPFTKIPIIYERAYGGSTAPANPIGCGEDDEEQPNILDPGNAWRPAGFGPISAAWPLRSKRLGDTPRRNIEGAIMDLPRSVDAAYFQSSPQDQQIAELTPDTIVVLEGFDPERTRVEAALPRARAVGAVYGLDGASPDAPTELVFRADTLHIDADRWICAVTFRAYVSVRDEAMLEGLYVVAGVGIGDGAPVIPSRRPELAEATARGAPTATFPGGAASRDASGTLDLMSLKEPEGATLPFQQGNVARPLRRAPLPPVAHEAKEPAAPAAVPHAMPAPLEPLYAMPSAPVVAMPSAPVVAAPKGPQPKASDFFHKPSKVRDMGKLAPRAEDEALPAASPGDPAGVDNDIEIAIERYARICAALAEPGAKRREVLAANALELSAWRKAEQHFRGALEREATRGERALRDRFDRAYVSVWEAAHPGVFGLPHYARLVRAEKNGLLMAELSKQGLEASMAMRLKRVWQGRIESDDELSEELERVLGELNGQRARGAGDAT
jgi:hypothetical protein